MKRILIPALATSLLATACLESDEPLGPDCTPISSQVASTQGDTVTTSTGLRHLQVTAGTGATVESCEWAAVSYTGTRTSGEQFDEGAFEFLVGGGGLIAGFEEGVLGMQVGGERRIIVPPSLGYGASATHPLRNDTLIFDINLLAAE